MLITLPDLLDAPTLAGVRESLQQAAWQNGKRSADGKTREVKQSQTVSGQHASAREASGAIVERLSQHQGFKAAALPKVILPLQFCRYVEGAGYGLHLDKPLMGTSHGSIRTDISATIFISESSEYEGGDLVFETDYGVQYVRAEAGQAVLYPASTLHRVEPVTRGTRVVAITWIQSQVRDPAKRKILFDLAQVATELDAASAHDDHALRIRQSQFNLLRLWAEP